MNTRATAFAAILLLLSIVGNAHAADRFVSSTGTDAGDCETSDCATIAYALTQADPGDRIVVKSDLEEGEIVISKDFITITNDGSQHRVGEDSSSPGATDFEFIFEINADYTIIDDLEIFGDVDTFAGVRVVGNHDNWTIRNNLFTGMSNNSSSDGFEALSFGIWAEGGTGNAESGFSGVNIYKNEFHTIGGNDDVTPTFNETAGVGIYVKSAVGDYAECEAFPGNGPGDHISDDCGAWIHENDIYDLFQGKNEDHFDEPYNDPNGVQPSFAMILLRDDNDANLNSGILVEDNDYNTNVGASKSMDVGVRIATGGSKVDEENANFATDVDAFVVNVDRRAVIDEIKLSEYWKSTESLVYGTGTDAYYRTSALADAKSEETATIVHLDGGTPVKSLEVTGNRDNLHFTVSLDKDGNLNVRDGAVLLYDDELHDGTATGVDALLVNGSDDDDMLTVDFEEGNPIPGNLSGLVKCTSLRVTNSDKCGLEFDAGDGFDRLIIRGDGQLVAGETIDNQSIVMGGGSDPASSGSVIFGSSTETYTAGSHTLLNFLDLEPIDDIIHVDDTFSFYAPNDGALSNEINIIDGPEISGEATFQINSGAVPTFEKVNFANKRHVNVYGSDDSDDTDYMTLFTRDTVPDRLLSLSMLLQDGDDFLIVRPDSRYTLIADGGLGTNFLALDCADTTGCDPASPATHMSITSLSDGPGAETVDLEISKEITDSFDLHPGDEASYKLTVTNTDGVIDASEDIYVTDVIDRRLTLLENSLDPADGTEVLENNLWKIPKERLKADSSVTLTYKVIVNTRVTQGSGAVIPNYASILNQDAADGSGSNNHDNVDLTPADVYTFPSKADIQAAVFSPSEAGPRYIVGLFSGALDPAHDENLGAVLCRVPEPDLSLGWNGVAGSMWYSCHTGELPITSGVPDPLVVTDLMLDSGERIWLTSWGQDGLYYSDDGARSWIDADVDLTGGTGDTPDGTPDSNPLIYTMVEDSRGTLFIGANNGDVYRSFDRGSTWEKAKQLPLGSASTAFAMVADPSVPGKIIAGTAGFGIYVTDDFGATWTKPAQDGLGNGHIFDIEFEPNTGEIFLATARGVYVSADGGATFTSLNAGFDFPNVPPETRSIAFDSNGTLYVATWGFGVYVTTDWKGTNLSQFALKSENIYDLTVADDGKVYALSGSAEMYSIEPATPAFSTDTEDEIGGELPAKFELEQNYPNPFNPTTTIQFTLPEAADVQLAVYDLLGRRVALLADGSMSAGRHSVTFEASNVPSGMYLYRLSTPNTSVTRKMVLLK